MNTVTNVKWKNLIYTLPFIMGLIWFFTLEKAILSAGFILVSDVDYLIPFNRFFIIPYLLWYPYIIIPCVYFFFKSPLDFKKLMGFLSIGMFLSCVIFTVYPNGQMLRPSYAGEGIMGALIHHLYYVDTPTNSLPSLHVIYSIGAHISLVKARVKINKAVIIFSFINMALIIMSTVFIKQHSVLDVVAGLIVSAVIYLLVYMPRETRVFGKLIRQAVII